MKLLANTKISVKIIAMLLLLGAITSFIAWNGAAKIMYADTVYSDAINDSADNTNMARAHRNLMEMVYDGYQAVVYNDDRADQAQQRELQDFNEVEKILSDVRKNQPQLAGKLEEFQSRAQQVHVLTARAAELGKRNQDKEAAEIIARADTLMKDFGADIAAFTQDRTTELSKLSDHLTDDDISISHNLLIMAALGVLGGVAAAYFLTRSTITGPLSRLQGQMGEIASGDYRKDVEGIERGDEVGAMAQAVRVFRENGIAKEAADAAKARADAEQKMVVDTVSTHLSELSGGDLTAAITSEFPG